MKNQTEFQEGDVVTAFNRKTKGREKATVVNVYDGFFIGESCTKADVQFEDGTVSEGRLVGLLRPVGVLF